MTNKRKIRRARNLDGKRKELMKKRGLTYGPYTPIPDDIWFYVPYSSRFFRSSPGRIKLMCDFYNALFNYYKSKQE